MNVGFIGTGSMGSVLIESLIRSGALAPFDVTATNRTVAKAERLADKYAGLRVAYSNPEVASCCDIVFLCVKPGEFKKVIDEIKPHLRPEQIVVSITSPVMIRHLEEQLPCKIAKIIPSITNYVMSGPTICMYSSRVTDEDKIKLEKMLGRISRPIRVDERHTRVTSDIACCGPAFFAFMLQRFIDAAVAETGIDREEATRLASEMLLGTGMLLTAGDMTPETLKERVTVPGGITEQGLKMMEKDVAETFHRVIRATHTKYNNEVEKLDTLFREPAR